MIQITRPFFAAWAVISTVLFVASPAGAQVAPSAERARMTAVRMTEGETITLDGELNEPVWQRAVPASDFIQQIPQTGSPACPSIPEFR